jgi:hypothetical protein
MKFTERLAQRPLCGSQIYRRYVGSGSRAGPRSPDRVALNLPVAAERHTVDSRQQ